MVSIGTITYLGSHGAEQLRPGWTEAVLDPAVAEWARRIREFGRAQDTADARRLRVRIEDKGAIVAFHWRGAPDDQAAHAAVAEIAQRAEQDGLKPHWGRKVLEVRPPVTIDKGLGVRRLLRGVRRRRALGAVRGRRHDRSRRVSGARSDAPGRRAAARAAGRRRLRRGAVRRSPSEADLVVDGPTGVRELLTLLAAGAADGRVTTVEVPRVPAHDRPDERRLGDGAGAGDARGRGRRRPRAAGRGRGRLVAGRRLGRDLGEPRLGDLAGDRLAAGRRAFAAVAAPR